MELSIAYCGLDCSKCPALIAKRDNNQELREKTAKAWSGHGFSIKPEEINCDGCHSNKELLTFCAKCSVRNCAIEKGYNTCADCGDYPCSDKLETLWKQIDAPQSKETLDKLRN
ncbi:MAG: DUF3795 domain-containing protein [Promethearchaeota archaeon]